MNQYVTGQMIKKLREEKKMTQQMLAEKINVSDKTVSKWENGRGYPDISLLEPIADALGISVIELLAGENVTNTNRSFNMQRMKFYVCPVCGNVLFSTGDAVISCCGIVLPALDVEESDQPHELSIEKVEDEFYVTSDHPMTKDHYLSFMAAVKDNSCEIVKLYPEGNAEARFKTARTKYIYHYCNHHGLFRTIIKRKPKKD